MAELSVGDKDTIQRMVQRVLPRQTGEGFGALSVGDLRAAIDAIDAWAEANTSEFNQAIPLPARTLLSVKQKAWLLMYVISRRAEVA